jgi:glycosyltransferase involved in cell wall biosynthesis
MKLVIDLRMINSSGIGTYLKNVVPGILRLYKEVIFLGNTEELKKFNWVKNHQIIHFDAKVYSIKEQLIFPKIIPKCDVYWGPHFNLPLLPIPAKKILTTIYDVNHLSGINPTSFLKNKYAYLLYKNAVLKSDKIFTISEFSKKEIIKYTNANQKKIEVIYCGVNRRFYENTTTESHLSLPEKYILFVGNVKPHKNLLTLLKAYLTFSEEIRQEYKIVIVGKKEGFITEDREIFEFIERNNLNKSIFFTGYVPDNQIPEIYRKASMFVFPSLYEGFGLPILEAIASRTPVISSNAASLPEVGTDSILYFNPLDFEELAQKITHIIENPTIREELIKKALPRLDFFTWEKAIEEHISVLKSI